MSLVEIFCIVDDFCKEFEPRWQQYQLDNGLRKRKRKSKMTLSEIMTIVIYFHQSNYRTFKSYYLEHVCKYHREEFPSLLSYSRFVHLMGQSIVPLTFFLYTQRGTCTGISFIDSTSIKVCHNRRIQRNKVFRGLASRGRSTMGWFFGFKLHLVINDRGEILTFHLTPGNVNDLQPVPVLMQDLFGKVFADKGYISQQLFKELLEKDIHLITGIRKNMKNRLMYLNDKILLRRRSIIETVNGQLKNISQIEHTRHRSFTNFLVNLLSGLLAYCFRPNKPSVFSYASLPSIP